MNYSIIIAEFNPLSNGHKFIIDKTKELFPDDKLIVVMSGNFVQRGEPAIIDKFTRAEVATSLGVDAVIELPTLFAISSAEDFALGAVKIASCILGAKRVVFGSECGDINKLKQTAQTLLEKSTDALIKKYLSKGYSYAYSVRKALKSEILLTPNNLLGVEYIKAIKKLNLYLEPVTIKRENNYNDLSITNFASSSAIRHMVIENKLDELTGCLPNIMLEKLSTTICPNYDKLFSCLFFKLLTTDSESLQQIDGVSEGIEYGIIEKINSCSSFNEFIKALTTKRYPEGKVKRISLNVLLGITKQDKTLIKSSTPILNLLAVSKDKSVLSDLAHSNGTLICKLSDVKKLDYTQQKLYNTTTIADKIYSHLTGHSASNIYKHKI